MCCYFGWIQGVEIIRGCRGLNLVGCDLVEVSPPYDTTGTFFPLHIAVLYQCDYYLYRTCFLNREHRSDWCQPPF